MSRTNLPITSMTIETVTAHSIGTAIVHAAGMEIDAKGDTGKLLLRFDHTTSAEKVVTIKAPTANPHAPRAPLGDLAMTFAAGNDPTTHYNVVIESARFAQADGKIHIDFESDTTGFVWAYRLPRGG